MTNVLSAEDTLMSVRGCTRNRLRNILVGAIIVPHDRPPPDPATVAMLKESMADPDVGLINPISVQRDSSGMSCYLVAGRNRLQAAEELGWETIDVIELPRLDGSQDAETIGRLAEIVENLHRRELDDIERGELLTAWTKLREERLAGQVGQLKEPGKGRGSKGGVSQTARDLGMPRKTVARTMRVATLSPEAKQAARKYGLASNQSALLEAAKQTEPIKQVTTLRRRAATQDMPKTDPKPKAEPRALSDLKEAWEAASEDVRETFLEWAGRRPT